jgi:hypothetical protein
MTTEHNSSMCHFGSQDSYQEFVEELATTEAEAIEEWGAYEVAVDVVAQVEDRGTEIQVGDGSEPDANGIDTPICPITVLEYSNATSCLPTNEVESISHLAAELLEQDLNQQTTV